MVGPPSFRTISVGRHVHLLALSGSGAHVEPTSLYRPRVSRETRLLLIAGLLAVAALWLLARIRFRDLPSAPSPIPAVLSQLNSGPKLDDLAAEVAGIGARLEPSLVAVEGRLRLSSRERTVALRYQDDLAIALLPAGSWTGDPAVLARDPAFGIALVRVGGQAPASAPAPWLPRRPERPRYLVATDISEAGLSLRPVYVGSLGPIDKPLWSDKLWAVPASSEVKPGSFLFTLTGEFVGLVIGHGTGVAIVPGSALLAEAGRLRALQQPPAGRLGVEVQPLTAALASVTGATRGVVVSWVDRAGAAARHLNVGDTIEAVGGQELLGREDWDLRMARLPAGQTLTLRIRSRGQLRDVTLVAEGQPAPAGTLGLTLRNRPQRGSEVTGVEPGAAGDRAGVMSGDVITLVGGVRTPTPAQVRRAFSSLGQGQGVLLGIIRGSSHLVIALQR